MKHLRWGATVVLGSLAVYFFVREAARHEGELRALSWSPALGLAFAASVAIHVGAALLDGWSWAYLLRALGVPASDRSAVSIFSVSQFGKYLPGNVAQHLGRLAMARDEGWSVGLVVLSLFVENAVAVGVGGLLVVVASPVWSLPETVSSSPVVIAAVAATPVVAVVAIRHLLAHPPAFVLTRMKGARPVELPLGVLVVYFGVHLASYLAMAFAVASLMRGLGGVWPANALLLPSTVALAWLAGYLVPGSPAGLGVREAVMTAVLGNSVGTGVVVLSVLLWRVCSLTADGVVFGIGWSTRQTARSA